MHVAFVRAQEIPISKSFGIVQFTQNDQQQPKKNNFQTKKMFYKRMIDILRKFI